MDQVVLNSLGLAFLTILTSANLLIQSKTKKDTGQINNAVNHVEEGSPTLTQRVDVMAQDLVVVKATALVADNKNTLRFDQLDETISVFGTTVDTLMAMHLDQVAKEDVLAKDVAAIREVMDNRKNSFNSKAVK